MITVIVPIHNTEKYLKECLDSIAKQTYTNLEVLCINSSTDNSIKIINSYIESDPRFKVINDDNLSYGYKVNLGIKLAKGEYVGIVDSDDFIDTQMYEKAIKTIKKDKLDFVKYNFNSFYYEKNNIKWYLCQSLLDTNRYNKIFNISKYNDIFYQSRVAIWACLYSKKFLNKYNIRLLESPKASFQDTSFAVLTHLYGRKIKYIDEAYYWYRTDNIHSSVVSLDNAYAIIDECHYFEEESRKYKHMSASLKNSLIYHKINTYNWNYRRLTTSLALKFAFKVKKELKQYYQNGLYEKMPLKIKNGIDQMYYAKKIGNGKISIIIPVYNKEKYLENTIKNITNQNYKNIEIIFVDDGSTDNSINIIKQLTKNDRRIKIIKQKHKGLPLGRNKGLKKATGDYVLFMNVDNKLVNGAILRILCLSIKHNCDAVEFDKQCDFENDIICSKKRLNTVSVLDHIVNTQGKVYLLNKSKINNDSIKFGRFQ